MTGIRHTDVKDFSPLLRGATPIRPLAGGPVACPQTCS